MLFQLFLRGLNISTIDTESSLIEEIMNITIVSGTNREGSMSLKVSQHLQKMYAALGVNAQVLDLRALPLACFTPHVYSEKPKELEPYIDMILNAQGAVFVIPEYNGSFPGVLKYFIDLWKFPDCYLGLKTAYVGIASGQWGALRAVEHFQGVMGYRNAIQFPERIFINRVGKRWNGEGFSKLLESDFSIDDLLNQQTHNFVDFCRKNEGRG